MINTLKQITDLLNAIWPYVALASTLYAVIYAFLKNNHLVKGNSATDDLYNIAENAVLNQDRYKDLTGEQKFENAVKAVLEMAKTKGIKTTDANACGAVQKAFANANYKGILEHSGDALAPVTVHIKPEADIPKRVEKTVEPETEPVKPYTDSGQSTIPDAPVEIK